MTTPARRKLKPVDDEWLASIAEAYPGIDLNHQLGMARVWCRTNNRECTRRFFVNWMNRVIPIKPKDPEPLPWEK